MVARIAAVLLLLVTSSVALSSPLQAEEQTPFERHLAAGLRAERAGRYAEAQKQFSAAIAEARKAGPGDRRLGIAISNLSFLYSQMGEKDKSLALMKEALTADERALGPTDARVVNELGNLAVMYEGTQDAEAEKLFKRALEIQEQNPEISDYQKMTNLRNLGELYREQHRYAECAPLLERAIEILANSSPPQSPQWLVEMRRSLADVYRQEGKEREAEELEISAYDSVRPLGSPAVNSLLMSMQRAEDSRRDGNLVAAEAGFRDVIAATQGKSSLPYSSIHIAALESLARLCAAGERDDEAEELFLRAFALREQYAAPGDRWMAKDLSNTFDLLSLYWKEGRLWEMEPVYKRALAAQEKVLGPDDDTVADTLLQFAQLYRREQKYYDALPLYQRALKIREKDWGPCPRLAAALGDYAGLLKLVGEDDEAATVFARAKAMRKRSKSP
jgi:tetratricopeptide (TPR) repeat protein